MSASSLAKTNPALRLYEAIIILKNQKLREIDAEVDQLRQENKRLRMPNSNRNQQEHFTQRVTQLEENRFESRSDNLRMRNQIDDLRFLLDQVVRQKQLRNQQNLMPNAQNVARNENKIEKQSGRQQNTSVLILGGMIALNTIYLFDSKAQSWRKLSITLPVEMRDFGAVVLNEEIYIFGGYVNYNAKQDCYKLKKNGSWMKLASLNQKRTFISSSSLVYKGDIWVIGGGPLKSVEKYDSSQDKWTYMPEINYARRDAAAAVFKDRIFVTGGWNGEKLKSVEMFDPKLQKWIFFCDLPFEVTSHTILISNSTLSIFGGESGFKSRKLKSVWEMDIEDPEKKWTKKPSFNHPRACFGVGKLLNEIIVFGDETSEIFDGNEWIDGPKLPQTTFFAYTSIPRSLEESLLNTFS